MGFVYDPVATRNRFMASFVESESGCWEWTVRISNKGYGEFNMRSSRIGAHRASWIFHRGEIPDGLWVLHRCDNPKCVNPDHLFLGTVRDNMRDCSAKGRLKSGVGRGEGHIAAKLTEADAIKIYEMRAIKKIGARKIAAQFGIKEEQVRRILKGIQWKDIPRVGVTS